QILHSNPTNIIAKEGLVKIGLRYENWARAAINKGDFNKALSYIKSLQKVNPQSPALPKLNHLLKRSKKKALVKKTTQRKLLSSSKKKAAKRTSHNTTKKISKRCDNIFSQESLGIRALTNEQKRFKRISCK
ncbi:MAG: hypothetical protein KAG43_00770, partial [Candidatus Marithrix sp.]|nr:hypothetical protein [Candidatus Marithrix sp.]